MTKITIGARGSKLSLAYVEKVKGLLLKENSVLKEENIDFKAIKTSGDINKNINEINHPFIESSFQTINQNFSMNFLNLDSSTGS